MGYIASVTGTAGPDPETLRAAVSRRRRDQEVVVVLHPDVMLDDVAFQDANPGVTVRRSPRVPGVSTVIVFDRADLAASQLWVTERLGLEPDPGSG